MKNCTSFLGESILWMLYLSFVKVLDHFIENMFGFFFALMLAIAALLSGLMALDAYIEKGQYD